jgi:hypothetical protein
MALSVAGYCSYYIVVIYTNFLGFVVLPFIIVGKEVTEKERL